MVLIIRLQKIVLYSHLKLQTAKVGYPSNEYSYLLCTRSWAKIDGGHDLACCNNGNWVSSPFTYPKVDIPPRFNVNDYKVQYQIDKYRRSTK